MERSRMVVGKFELNFLRRLISSSLEFYLTPKIMIQLKTEYSGSITSHCSRMETGLVE